MNIEQTKRMNLMVKELTKSGVVSSLDDAVGTAAGLYDGAMPQDKNVSKVLEATRQMDGANGAQKEEQMQESPPLETGSETEEHADASSGQGDTQEPRHPQQPSIDHETVKRCVQEGISANNQSIAQDMRALYEQIQKVQKEYQEEIKELKKEIKELKASRPAGQQELSQEPKKKEPEKKEPENPRQGSYSPEGVVLENYFYYGTK